VISRPYLDVLRCASMGLTSAETARELHMSVHNVKSHLRTWMHKLGARNTVHAVSIAHTTGLFGDLTPDALPCPNCRGRARR
jgi:DNA-binding NarL/FixJ family response regulator